MTSAFELFMKEHSAKRREKLDGYSLSNLNGLDPSERATAVRLLAEEVRCFPGAVEPLACLDPAMAKTKLIELVSSLPTDSLSRRYDVWFWLWKLTANDKYAEHLVAAKDTLGESDLVPFFVTLTSAIESPVVKRYLMKAVFEQQRRTVLSVIATALLENGGISIESDKTEHIALWKELCDGDIASKKSVLARLK